MASAKESDNYDNDKEKFLFHMTDWNSSLESLVRFYSNPDDFRQEDANRVLQELFYHVLPHLNAAAEIYDDATELYKMHSKSKPT
jgi:hypothetical protein